MKRTLLLLSMLLGWCIAVDAQSRAGLDPLFGDRGIVIERGDSWGTGQANDLVVQPDGKIVVAGNGTVYRYLSNGNHDSSFATNGSLLIYNLSPRCYPEQVLIQPDGKLVLVGNTSNNNEFFALRLKSSGAMDSTFGTAGLVTGYFGLAFCGALQADGKILIAGDISGADASVVVRLKQNGTFDSTFGTNGYVTQFLGQYGGSIDGLDIMADGRIVIGGIARLYDSLVSIRYLPDGRLDTSLNHSGIVHPFQAAYCRDLKVQPDGKILLAGSGGLSGGGFVSRLNLDGSLDPSYGNRGMIEIPAMNVRTLKLYADGRALCAGDTGDDDNEKDFAIARIKANGQGLDSIFGHSGLVVTQIAANSEDRYHSIALQSDNKIVAAGYTRNYPAGENFTVARYLPDAPATINNIRDRLLGISIFPIPANESLKVELPSGIKGAMLTLTSMNGQVLIRQYMESNKGTISTGCLTPGIYTITIVTRNGNFTQLITKE